MGDFFNVRRFASYAGKTYRENARKYLMYSLLVFGAQMFWVMICAINGWSAASVPHVIFSFMAIILAVLFVFSEMYPLRNRHTAPLCGTQPVSIFERYLLIWFNTTVLFLVVYILSYWLLSLVSSGIFNYGDMSDYWKDRSLLHIVEGMIEGVLVFNALAMFAGGTNIKSHLVAFIVVTLVGVPLLGLPVYLPWFINSNLLDGIAIAPYFNGISETVHVGNTVVEYDTVPMFGKFYESFVGNGYELFVWSVLLWVTGYFKLKERQVK